MNKILLGVGALVLGLAFVGDASAAPPGHYHGGRGRAAYARSYHRSYYGARPYYMGHGVRYRGSYWAYPRGHHTHWSRVVWSPTYRRYHYYDPYLRCEYYYDRVTLQYLPVVCN